MSVQAVIGGDGFLKNANPSAQVGTGGTVTLSEAGETAGVGAQAAIGIANAATAQAATWDSIAKVAGSNATRTAQTLADITGLTAAVLHAHTYEFEAVLQVVASADTNGMEVGVAVTQTPVSVQAIVTGNTATTTVASVAIVAAATATAAFNTSSTGVGEIVIKGHIVTHATLDGTLSIQHLKVTSGTSTVLIGSTLKVKLVA